MTLRNKVVLILTIAVVFNILATAFVVESSYLARSDFDPEHDQILAPEFWHVSLTAAAFLRLSGIAIYFMLRRSILEPISDVISEAERVARGGATVLRGVNRGDEIGELAKTFNRMAGEVFESKSGMESKARDAVAEVEKAHHDFALAERFTATGRVAVLAATSISKDVSRIAELLQQLRKEKHTSEQPPLLLRQIEENVRSLQGKVWPIIEYAKPKMEIGPVSVRTALADALALVRSRLEGSRISLVEQIEENQRSCEDRMVTIADKGDLEYVFVNLLGNAIDAMPRGGVLTVRAERVLKWIIVEVIDTGIGLTLTKSLPVSISSIPPRQAGMVPA